MSDALEPTGHAHEFREPEGLRLKTRVWVGRRSQWFEAVQTRLNRVVALKYLRPFLAESPIFREAFIDAGRQASVIVHPSALPVFNVYPSECCIAMQWCSGKPLKEFESSLDPFRVARIGETVMDCLSSLHATGRCHGNLSPGNVFLSDDGTVSVNDFFQPPLMTDGEHRFIGLEKFISPEIVATGSRGWASDAFSLGRILSLALDPAKRPVELGHLLDALQEENPAERGGTPRSVLESFRRIRKLEEARQGRDGVTMRRVRRMYRRIPAEFDVSLRRRSATPGETAVILMKTRDIGESGVFVETDDDLLVVGSILELDFTLKGVEGNVHAFGIVRWRSAPPMPKGVGVQFVEVDQAGLARLRQFLGNR